MLANNFPSAMWSKIGLILALLLLSISIVGIDWVQRNSAYYNIKNYSLHTYEGGLYLGDLKKGVYYNLSAYDSYFEDPVSESTVSPLLPYSDEYSIFGNKFQNFMNLYKSYFKKQTPTVVFKGDKGKIILESHVDQDTVNFVIKENSLNKNTNNDLLLAFTYSEDDSVLETTPAIRITNPNIAGSLTFQKTTSDFEFVRNDTVNKILFFKVLDSSMPSLSLTVN